MKTIIAGGRTYQLTMKDWGRLYRLPITEVVSGGALGADRGGEQYAMRYNLPVKLFPADWSSHGKAAGPIRNREMAKYADAVALFPGGRGTESMAVEAKRAGIRVFDFRFSDAES